MENKSELTELLATHNLTTLFKELSSLGVTEVDDLQYLTPDILENIDISIIQRRKLEKLVSVRRLLAAEEEKCRVFAQRMDIIEIELFGKGKITSQEFEEMRLLEINNTFLKESTKERKLSKSPVKSEMFDIKAESSAQAIIDENGSSKSPLTPSDKTNSVSTMKKKDDSSGSIDVDVDETEVALDKNAITTKLKTTFEECCGKSYLFASVWSILENAEWDKAFCEDAVGEQYIYVAPWANEDDRYNDVTGKFCIKGLTLDIDYFTDNDSLLFYVYRHGCMERSKYPPIFRSRHDSTFAKFLVNEMAQSSLTSENVMEKKNENTSHSSEGSTTSKSLSKDSPVKSPGKKKSFAPLILWRSNIENSEDNESMDAYRCGICSTVSMYGRESFIKCCRCFIFVHYQCYGLAVSPSNASNW